MNALDTNIWILVSRMGEVGSGKYDFFQIGNLFVSRADDNIFDLPASSQFKRGPRKTRRVTE